MFKLLLVQRNGFGIMEAIIYSYQSNLLAEVTLSKTHGDKNDIIQKYSEYT